VTNVISFATKNGKNDSAIEPELPILPPEIIDEILIYIGRVGLVYSLDRLPIMKHFLPEKFEVIVGQAYCAVSGDYVDGMPASNLVDWAASTGRLRYLRYLTENTTNHYGTTHAMDSAAFYGHFEVVKYLHFNRTEGCTMGALDCSTSEGHLDIVKFLHEYRN
jgi:hypothetical protein